MGLYEDMANSHPKLKRGMVWCLKCGNFEKVKSNEAMLRGWPMCCGQTMSLESKQELKEKRGK